MCVQKIKVRKEFWKILGEKSTLLLGFEFGGIKLYLYA